MARFINLARVDADAHCYTTCDCVAENGDLAGELAAVVRELYVETEKLESALKTASADLGSVADQAAIEAAIRRTVSAAIPPPGTHPVPQLDVARNELAEVVGMLALPALHGTVVPASRVRNKEVSGQPARGTDLLGLDDSPLMAVMGEVKASASTVSPPAVVGDGDRSMRAQLRAALDDKDRLLAELNWALKHAPDQHRALVAKALLAHTLDQLEITVAPVLVRPNDHAREQDYGVFRDDPDLFAPAPVRFCLIRLGEPLDELARAVYERARA